jgi:molecular chaperone DnaK
MGKAIGIDLGTTNTAVAVLIDGRPRVLEDERGYKVLPSCVSMKADGQFVVGQAARNLAIINPERTVYAVKRLIGRRFDSPEAVQIRSRVSYAIGPADDGSCLVQMGDDWYTPTEVCALVLQVARGIAERALDEEVTEAVITVPAYFNHQQRAATLEAAKMAGLRCERLLNEPTAAALAYGHRKDIERTIAVYDLGGGTFDVSVLHLSKGVYEVLSTAGETHLGGEDFDYRLLDHLADEFHREHGVDLRKDPTALQRLKDAAERAKCELSFTDRTTVLIPRIADEISLESAVSRLTLEGLVQDRVDRTLEIARQAVQDAGLQLSDIDDVILVGGQTRMPRVREAITALFQVEPSRSVHPEEVVAIGAAVHASSLTESDGNRPLLLDVTPFELGIDVAGGLFQPIISRNAHVPAAGSRVFATAHDSQQQVEVTVRQGDSRFAHENEFLGRFIMGGLTAAPRMQTKVEVTFRLDSNGMLHVSAVEQGTGERKQITIQNYAEVAQDGTAAKIEGDVAEGPPSATRAPANKATAAPAKAPGFFGRLFGRKKAKAAKTSQSLSVPAGAARLPEPAPPGRADELDAATAERDASQHSLSPVDALESLDSVSPMSMVPLDDEEPMSLSGDALESLPGQNEEHPAWSQQPQGSATPPTDLGAPDLGASSSGSGLGFALGPDDDDDEDDDDDDLGGVDPFAAGSDPFASGADPFASDADAGGGAFSDPFAAPESDDDDDTEDEAEAFAMPLEDEEGYAQEESWDHSGTPAGGAAPGDAQRAPAEPVAFADSFPEFPASLADAAPEPLDGGRNGLMQAEDAASLTPTPPRTATAAKRSSRPSAAPVMRARGKGRSRRKPARLKLAYNLASAMVAEYRENLRRGGCFVRTPKPLAVGRECRIEVRAPGLDEPIQIPGVVTWSSVDQATLGPDQSEGMGIEYRLDPAGLAAVEEALASIGG